MFSRMSKFLSFGASATVCASPHPNRSISRLSRAASMSPVTGVRLTQTMSRMSALSAAQASTTKGISARGPVPNDTVAARRGIGPAGKQLRTDRAEPLRR